MRFPLSLLPQEQTDVWMSKPSKQGVVSLVLRCWLRLFVPLLLWKWQITKLQLPPPHHFILFLYF